MNYIDEIFEKYQYVALQIIYYSDLLQIKTLGTTKHV